MIMITIDEEESTYGYELTKKLKEKSNGHWDLTHSTVYEALSRMEDDELVKRTEKSKKDRKYYQLTNKGEKVLQEKKDYMEEESGEYQNMALGFLNLYRNLFDEEKFQELVEKIEKEFET